MSDYQMGLRPPKSLNSRGIFYATRDEVIEMCKADSEAKLLGLADAIVRMKTKSQRQAFLMGFEKHNGPELTNLLKGYVIDSFNTRKMSLENSPNSSTLA